MYANVCVCMYVCVCVYIRVSVCCMYVCTGVNSWECENHFENELRCCFPVCKMQGHKSGGPNEIWEFGNTTEVLLAGLITLREQLRP